MPPLHEDELAVDAGLVRRLVGESLPEYDGLPVTPLSAPWGSTNALYRLGEELLVRLPLQPGGSTAIEQEARWLPHVAERVTTAVPEIVFVGEPGGGYPEKWAVTTWLEGSVPVVPPEASRDGSRRLALDLARFVTELGRVEVPPAAREDPALTGQRGGRLAAVDDEFRHAVEACRHVEGLTLDLDRALEVWDGCLAAEATAAPMRTWHHGDLLAENLLTRDRGLAAVLDFGGLGVGDPAVDLIVAWEVLDAPGRTAFRRAVDVDDVEWAKGIGWALFIAVITFPYYWRSMPARCVHRHSMAAAVLAES